MGRSVPFAFLPRKTLKVMNLNRRSCISAVSPPAKTPSLRSALFIYAIGTMRTNENTKPRDACLIRTPTGFFFLRTYWHSRSGGHHSRRPPQGQEDRSGSHQRNIRREALTRAPTGCSINQRERREKRYLGRALSGDSFELDQSPRLSIPIGFPSPRLDGRPPGLI